MIQGIFLTAIFVLAVGVSSIAGEIARFEFRFEQQLISAVSIDIGDFPQFDPNFPRPELNSGLTNQNLKTVLAEYFEALEAKDRFSGAVLIQQGDTALFEGAYGLASRRYKIPNSLNTRFDVGSITKEFTKVAVAQLLERGVLALEDKISRHLPNYPNRSVAEKVSIGQLVDHTSGLGDVFTPEYFKSSKLRFRSPSDYIEIFADDPLLFEPGQGKAYSNYGYIVLGAIIEEVSGQGYFDYIRSNLFEVAGMKHSGFFPSDEPVPEVAIGYTRTDGDGQASETVRNNILLMPVNGAPDGGSHSTVYDLSAFDTALRAHRLLTPPYTRWILGGPEPAAEEDYESGSKEPAKGSIGIAGGAPGLNAVLLSDGERRIIVLANMDEPVAEQVAEILSGELDW